MWTENEMPKSPADIQYLPDGYKMTELSPLSEEWWMMQLELRLV